MKRILAILVATAVVVAGCGGGLKDKIVGTWKIDLDSLKVPGMPPSAKSDPKYKSAMESMFGTARMEFKADGTAVPTNMGQTGGKWSVSGNEVVLEDEKGKAKDVKVTAESDGSRLHFQMLKEGQDNGGFDMVKAS